MLRRIVKQGDEDKACCGVGVVLLEEVIREGLCNRVTREQNLKA